MPRHSCSCRCAHRQVQASNACSFYCLAFPRTRCMAASSADSEEQKSSSPKISRHSTPSKCRLPTNRRPATRSRAVTGCERACQRAVVRPALGARTPCRCSTRSRGSAASRCGSGSMPSSHRWPTSRQRPAAVRATTGVTKSRRVAFQVFDRHTAGVAGPRAHLLQRGDRSAPARLPRVADAAPVHRRTLRPSRWQTQASGASGRVRSITCCALASAAAVCRPRRAGARRAAGAQYRSGHAPCPAPPAPPPPPVTAGWWGRRATSNNTSCMS